MLSSRTWTTIFTVLVYVGAFGLVLYYIKPDLLSNPQVGTHSPLILVAGIYVVLWLLALFVYYYLEKPDLATVNGLWEIAPENIGAEVDVKFTPILKIGEVRWNGGVNFAYFQSKVLSILPGLNEIPIPLTTSDNTNGATTVSYATVGEQFPNIKVTDVKRDPQGHIVVDAITGLPSKQTAIVQMGHGNPNQILGINTDLNYKGFRLSAVAEYRGGNVIDNAVGGGQGGGGIDFTGISAHTALNGRQSFIIPGSVIQTSPGVYVPNTTALVANASRGFWVNSDYANTQRAYVTSAAFWKLREVALTYDVPVNRLFGGKVIKMAQVGIVGRNLLMLRPKTNVWTDPEFNNSTSSTNAVGYTDTYQTPPTRLYGFSVKLTF